MRNKYVTYLIIAAFFFFINAGCGGSSGGGSNSTNPSKMYVGTISDIGTSNEVGGVGVDDLGNKMVSIQQTPGSAELSYILMTLEDGTTFYITVSDGTIEPAGVPTVLIHDSGTITFSNWNVANQTVDITITDGTDTETFTGVDYSDYVANINAKNFGSGDYPVNFKSPGAGKALYYAFTIVKVATCPASLLITGATFGWAFGLTVASCALAGTSLWGIFNDETTVENAAQNITESGNCESVQTGSGGTAAERENCINNSSASAESTGVYLDANGTEHTDGGGGTTTAGSCYSGTTGLCYNYLGSGWTSATAQDSCNDLPTYTYSTGKCTATNSLGSCSTGPSGAEIEMVYYSNVYTLELAQASCEATTGATWQTPYSP